MWFYSSHQFPTVESVKASKKTVNQTYSLFLLIIETYLFHWSVSFEMAFLCILNFYVEYKKKGILYIFIYLFINEIVIHIEGRKMKKLETEQYENKKCQMLKITRRRLMY